MPLNFEKLASANTVDSVLAPREIFRALPGKDTKFEYLRDVEAEVLDQWFEHRINKDLVIKMNTGSGKTLVGLLILKSCLNEKFGPALYVAPDQYLVKQIIKEAKDLGIKVTDEPKDFAYLKGKSVCVINIYKLVNGRSVFGVGEEGVKLETGSIIIDDAHACLSTIEGQFTLKIDATSKIYKDLFSLFRDSLSQQSETGLLEVESQDPTRNMLVPFWVWINKNNEVTEILHRAKDDNNVMFVWPLIKENLSLCRCVFGGGEVEISPRCLPIDAIPSFVNASRRIYMTATLADDSILITNFDADTKSIEKPITPKNSNDIGDRMILIPQELNTDITKEDIKAFLLKLSCKYNIIIIVPSNARAKFWEDVSSDTLTSTNLYEGITKLKNRHIGIVVLVNKYDGIDLPFDACRILVIDGIPDVRRKIDKIEQITFEDSEFAITREIQRIEQGMGRGIRATNDHCVVFLMDHNLVKRLYLKKTQDKFSAATKAQLNLSYRVAEQIRWKSIDEFTEIINYCLKKDPEWLIVSKGALVDLKYKEKGQVDDIVLKQREAFDYAQIKQFEKAVGIIQDAVDATEDKKLKGWLKQELAEYTHHIDPAQSQEILKSAISDNPRVLKPLEGIVYQKLSGQKLNQARKCSEYLQKYNKDSNELIIHLNALVDNLQFKPDTSEPFEKSVRDLATFIGFKGQRPELETGKGPDVVWAAGERTFFIIECKNGATSETISKTDCNQLSGSMNWFRDKYDLTCKGISIIVHPSNQVDGRASPYSGMLVINREKLENLKAGILNLGKAIVSSGDFTNYNTINKLLLKNNLTSSTFLTAYTIKYLTKNT